MKELVSRSDRYDTYDSCSRSNTNGAKVLPSYKYLKGYELINYRNVNKILL